MEMLSKEAALERLAQTADLIYAVLYEVDLTTHGIDSRRFQTVVFTSVPLSHARLTGCVFEECSFTGGGLAAATVAGSRFLRTTFADVSLAGATLHDSSFDTCSVAM